MPRGATVASASGASISGDADWDKCVRLYNKLFPRNECAHGSCDFSGAYQPPLTQTFYGFSYMYDRTTAIGLLDGVPKVFGEQAILRRPPTAPRVARA